MDLKIFSSIIREIYVLIRKDVMGLFLFAVIISYVPAFIAWAFGKQTLFQIVIFGNTFPYLFIPIFFTISFFVAIPFYYRIKKKIKNERRCFEEKNRIREKNRSSIIW